jgi:hypothetical protein
MGKKMRISIRPVAPFADPRPARALPWIFAAAVLAAVAAPGAADARKAGATGRGYDGIWNVLIITQAGSCDPAYSYPFRVAGGRISSAGQPMCPEALAGVAMLRSGFRPAAGWPRATAGLAAAPARAAGLPDCPAETAAAAGRRRGADHRDCRAILAAVLFQSGYSATCRFF